MREATLAGDQYICMDEGGIVGVFVLNDDPKGNYQAGSWKRMPPDGDYVVLHTLAVAGLSGEGHGIRNHTLLCKESPVRRLQGASRRYRADQPSGQKVV